MVSLGRATAQPALIVGRGARSTEALCMLRSFDRGAAGCGAETERREKLEHATGSGIPAPGMPPYDRPVTRSTWILATLLLLPACAPDVTLAPLDVPQADTAEDARAPDVGADAAALPDVAAPDASPPDVPPVDAAAPDAPADVSTPDAPEDVARDASPDVADAAPDRAVADAAPDATADVAPPCAERAVRCVGGSPEFCVSGAWVAGSCGSTAPTGATNTCAMDNCYACRRAASGTGCAAEPLCAEDVDCYRMGRGRCVAGLCARMGMIACAIEADCGAWQTSTTRVGCVENRNAVGGGVAMACNNTSRPCVDDAMCPRAYRCDLASGYCRAL